MSAFPLPDRHGYRPRHRVSCVAAALLMAFAAGGAAAQTCSSLNASDLAGLFPDSGSVGRMQSVLLQAYPDQVPGGRARFVDGVVGSNTLRLAGDFCRDLGLDFETGVGPALAQGIDAFGAITAADPGWRETLESPGFLEWSRSLEPGPVRPYYRIEATGPVAPTSVLLLADYMSRTAGTGQMAGRHVLTERALEMLAEPPRVIEFRVTEATIARLRTLGAPGPMVDAVQALRDLPEATEEAARTEVLKVIEFFATAAASVSSADSAGPQRPPLNVAAFREAVQIESSRPPEALSGPAVPEPVRGALEALVGVVFPNGFVFREAVRITAGVGPAQPAMRSRILAAARPSGPTTATPEMRLKPIEWDGDGCGCGTFVKKSEEYPVHLYGMYPFWAAPQEADSTDRSRAEPQVVDFSLLTGIGYFGLTFDRNGTIQDPLHWRAGSYPEGALLPWRRSHFQSFIETAHTHKTRVDAVLYNGDWRPWLPAPGGVSADTAQARAMGSQALTTLIDQAVNLISPELDGVLDRIKPIVALGQSPRRTLGDGITLDLDFQGLSRAERDWLFQLMEAEEFFPDFKARLGVAGGSLPSFFTSLDLQYALNLVVPGYCLVGDPLAAAECGFFSVEHLDRLEPYVNLFLVDFTKQPSNGARPPAGSYLARAETLRAALQTLPVDRQIEVMQKIVPMVASPSDPGPEVVQQLDSLFQYADWNYTGAGLWSIPVADDVNARLAESFVYAPSDAPASALVTLARRAIRDPLTTVESEVCRLTCPLRWPLRTFVFLAVLASLALWIVSIWKYEWKRVYATRTFAILRPVVLTALFATLWCDPFWNQQQPAILFVALAGLFVYSAITRVRRNRERDYP